MLNSESRFNFVIVSDYDVVLINTTPHSIMFKKGDGSDVEVPCSVLLNADVEEVAVDKDLVTTHFVPTEEGWQLLDEIKKAWEADPRYNPDYRLRIIGSIIACQAYPGMCQGMVPFPGFERVAPSEKRMRLDKFNVYGVNKHVYIIEK